MTITAIDLPLEKIAEFCDRWQVIEFALFGSVLRNDFCPESDIDVMVQFHPEAHPIFNSSAQVIYATGYLLGFRIMSVFDER
jgi:uncharacterized protein